MSERKGVKMNKDTEKKFISYSIEKDKRIEKLKEIEETKEICFEFVDGAIEKLSNNSPQYIEGYELRIANERRKLIEESKEDEDEDDEYFICSPQHEVENIKIDIVLRGINKELTIGEIDCNVKLYRHYTENYYVELNYISLDEEYQNKGYGTWVLKHIHTIISHLYKGNVIKVETTPEVITYDKYKIHEITYNERIKSIENWLIINGYEPNGRILKDNKIEFYEISLKDNESIDNYMLNFEKSLLDILTVSYSRNKSINKCDDMVKDICKNKYSDGIIEQKILRLNQIRQKIEDKYNKTKEYNEMVILAVDGVKQLYNSISLEDLEINKNDKINEIATKLYCKYFNYSAVGHSMAEMGYTTTNKGTNKKRNYIARELKEMIRNSNVENEKLKKYIEYIFIASEGCSNF